MKAAASAVAGAVKKRSAAACSRTRPRSHEHDVAGEPARLAEVVRRHHDLDAGRRRWRAAMSSTALVAAGIEARGRLVEEQHLRIAGERAGEREALLLAARQPSGRPVGQMREAGLCEQLAAAPRRGVAAHCPPPRAR